MARTEVAKQFTVTDDAGVLHHARLINVRDRIGGPGADEVVTEWYFELDCGDRLEPDLGNRTFFSACDNTMYTRVKERPVNS